MTKELTVDEMIERLMIISVAGNGDHKLIDDNGKPFINVFKDKIDMEQGNKNIKISVKGTM
jgi:hypothetical protein